DRDAGRQKWIFHQRKHRVQLGPREIERLEVFETARPQHAAFERLSPRRELWKEALGVDPGERRERLLARSGHAVGGNALKISAESARCPSTSTAVHSPKRVARSRWAGTVRTIRATVAALSASMNAVSSSYRSRSTRPRYPTPKPGVRLGAARS